MAYGYERASYEDRESRETREILNQPFVFEEVLVDHDARRTLFRAGKTNGVFASAEAPRAPSSLPVRKIAVRLRTINNACDAPFRMHDGRPVSEVSMYGSREPRYLIGPDWAVCRLMAGELPPDDRRELQQKLSKTCEFLNEQLGPVEAFLRDPESNSTEAQVAVAQQQKLQAMFARKVDPSTPVNTDKWKQEARSDTRRRLGIDLVPERLSEIREYSALLGATLRELRALESTFATAEWYWGWTDEMRMAIQRVGELGDAYQTKRKALRGPDWPVTRQAWGQGPRLCDGFDI